MLMDGAINFCVLVMASMVDDGSDSIVSTHFLVVSWLGPATCNLQQQEVCFNLLQLSLDLERDNKMCSDFVLQPATIEQA
jgi:hypothetical protein